MLSDNNELSHIIQNYASRKTLMNNTIITGHHLEITEAISKSINDKFESVYRKDPLIQNIKVNINKDSQKLKILKMDASGKGSGKEVFVSVEGEDLYSMIDSLVDKFERKIRKEKEKINSKKGRESIKFVATENEDE